MPLLICAATAKELAALWPDRFPDPAAIPEMRPLLAETRQGKLIFLVTGVGPINSALAMGCCLGLTNERKKITGILYAGLAGAFDLTLTPLCATCLINREIWPEYGLNDGVTVTARAFKHPIWERGAESIYEEIELGDLSTLPINIPKMPEWQLCASLTVAGVTASFQRRDTLWNRWHAQLENMEGFAAAYVALRAEIPFVEIRVVSNKTGPRRPEEKDFARALLTMGEILPSLNLI